MIQDIAPHQYHNEFSHRPPQAGDVLISFRDGKLLASLDGGALRLPQLPLPAAITGESRYLFSVDETGFYLTRQPLPAFDCFSYLETRALRNAEPRHLSFAYGAAESLNRWYSGNRFCGACGAEMADSDTERAVICRSCGKIVYPKICPAVIVAVTNGEKLLLTRYAGRAYKHYALVAGFNEIGESIEETVHREVLEETGLRVKNLRFYKSQPWIFTDSLLFGFFADLDGDASIVLQEDELCEGGWFSREQLPQEHSAISLTGEMIELFRSGNNP